MSGLWYVVIGAVFAVSQALAETAPPSAEGPGPLAKRIPCDAFKRQPDGAWVPTRDVNLELPDGNVLTVGSAVSFKPGDPVRGFDLGAVLDRECGSR